MQLNIGRYFLQVVGLAFYVNMCVSLNFPNLNECNFLKQIPKIYSQSDLILEIKVACFCMHVRVHLGVYVCLHNSRLAKLSLGLFLGDGLLCEFYSLICTFSLYLPHFGKSSKEHFKANCKLNFQNDSILIRKLLNTTMRTRICSYSQGWK